MKELRRRIKRHKPREFVKGTWAACDEDIWIISLSTKAGIWSGWSGTAGAIGLLVAMLVHRTTGGEVFVVDINSFRLQRALELGATEAINSLESNPVEKIMEKPGRWVLIAALKQLGRKQR